MESWSYVSEEKGLLSNDTLSPPTRLSRTKTPFFGWELKTPSNFANHVLASGQQNLENQGFEELGFSEMLGKQLSDDPLAGVPSRKMDFGAGGGFISPVTAAANAFSGGDDSNSKLSNSVVDSSSRDSLIDLKLGRLGDHRDDQDSTFSTGIPILSSSESSKPPKRARASGLQSQTAYCQVYGCNKDLSASKDYHKRHKVCEVHSKTAKVTVNGIEQRFCQQCSRFHLLVEFDDGKRSCRKRLAGHNERRRKPQAGLQSGKPGRLLQPYSDGRFQGTMLTAASFIRQEILPSGVLHSEKYGANDWWRPMKVEDGTHYRHLPALHITNSHPQPRSLFHSYNVDKQFPFFLHENGATTTTGSLFCENNDQYPPAIEGQISGPRSLFHETSLGSENFNVFDTASTIQGLSGIPDTGRALSLLSSQSQNSSSHSLGIPIARPLVIPSSHSHYSVSQVSDKIIGISSQASTSGASDRFPSEMNASDGSSHLGPVLMSNSKDIVNFEMADQGIFQGSDFVNVKDRLSYVDGSTINLLQLSSQLQRVEDQRLSMPVKQENDSSCCLRKIYGALEEET